MKFYRMETEDLPYVVVPGNDIMTLNQVCLTSAFQFLDHKPISVEIEPPEYEPVFPDFILYQSIPLVSDKFYRLLQRLDVDYLFFKPVRLTWMEENRKEPYWLALPPRVNCLNLERSAFADNDLYLPLRDAEQMVIRYKAIGRYQIFKVEGVVNQEILVTEPMKVALEKAQLENLCFYEMEA